MRICFWIRVKDIYHYLYIFLFSDILSDECYYKPHYEFMLLFFLGNLAKDRRIYKAGAHTNTL